MRLSAASCVLAIAALLGGASAAKAESDLSRLKGTFWRLDHIDGMPDDASRFVLHIYYFDLSGAPPGCGFWSVVGALKGQGSGPVLGAIAAGMSKIAGCAVKADSLEFFDDRSHAVLRFSRIMATGLENREWLIDRYFDGARLVTPARDAEVTFVNNSIDGSPGCGALGGTYSLSEARLRMSNVNWYLMGWCPPGFEPQNNAVVKALEGERVVEPDGQRIILRDDSGTVQIVLRPLDR